MIKSLSSEEIIVCFNLSWSYWQTVPSNLPIDVAYSYQLYITGERTWTVWMILSSIVCSDVPQIYCYLLALHFYNTLCILYFIVRHVHIHFRLSFQAVKSISTTGEYKMNRRLNLSYFHIEMMHNMNSWLDSKRTCFGVGHLFRKWYSTGGLIFVWSVLVFRRLTHIVCI